MTLWHFLEEEHGAGRCYHGTVKALRGGSNCIVEYDVAERFPESNGRNPSWDANGSPSNGSRAGAGAYRGRRRRSNGGGAEEEGQEEEGGWSGAGGRLDTAGGWTGGVRAGSCEEVGGC